MTDETTNPNRWTAEVGGAGRTRYVDVFDGGECLDNVECYSRKQAESLAEQINRPAPTAPADDLPPGVERISDGTYICRGIDVPEGWGFYGPAESIDASEDESRPWWDWRDRETDVRTGDVYYQVRPITPAEPATEWVPLHELRGRKLPGCEWIVGDFGTRGTPSEITPGYRAYREFATNDWEDFRVRPDGKVEVQR